MVKHNISAFDIICIVSILLQVYLHQNFKTQFLLELKAYVLYRKPRCRKRDSRIQLYIQHCNYDSSHQTITLYAEKCSSLYLRNSSLLRHTALET